MNETTDATALLAPLWRRKWWILGVALVVAAGSYLYYRREPSMYSAVTQIYLGNGAEEQSQIGASTGSAKKASAPNPATQAALINSSIIKEAVHAQLRRERKTAAVRAALKGKAKAKAPEKSEFIVIDGEARNARGAALLVNTTAQIYVKRENARYRSRGSRDRARAQAGPEGRSRNARCRDHRGRAERKGLREEPSAGPPRCRLATLDDKINQLESDLAISQVAQVDPATPKVSELVSPHPRRQRHLRVRDRSAAGRVRRVRTRPTRSPAAFAGGHRSGLPDTDPDRAAGPSGSR